MKTLLRCSVILMCVVAHATGSHALQGDLTRPTKPTKTAPAKTTPAKRNPPGATKPATPKTSAAPKVVTAGLTIITTPPGCAVLLDGQSRGVTDKSGVLKLNSLKPGAYTLRVSKDKYNDDFRTIALQPKANPVVSITLIPQPGVLNVAANVAGARFSISNIGDFDSVSDMQIAPGVYTVSVSRPGYRTATHPVTIKPAETINLPVSLVMLPVEELIAQAEESFRLNNFPQAIELTRSVLATRPEHPRAHALLGMSYYADGNRDESVTHLVKAISLGESVTFSIKHRHGGSWGGKGLCTGRLTLRRDGVEFYSNEFPDEGFRVPYSKVYEIGLKDMIRLAAKIGVTKGKKEEKKDYNFYSVDAEAGGTIVTCTQCQAKMTMLIQIIRQFRT